MGAEALPDALARELAPFGVNLIGVASPIAYDALVPASHRLGAEGARAVIVLGNGGGAFWEAFQVHRARCPDLADHPHPLDAFTTRIMEERALPLARRLGAVARLRVPFRSDGRPLSFVHLAEAAGLGRRSLLGVLVHPTFGPWVAFRGALLLDAEASAPRPADGFDPCPGCVERACVRACPAGAVTHPGGWDVAGCIDHRLARPGECESRCHARFECVLGRDHRYPADALAYHQGRAFAVMASARRASGRGPSVR